MSHIAIESGAFVVSCPQYIPRAAFPDDFPVPLPDDDEPLGRGGAAIFEPLGGKAIAGPLYDTEGIVTADIDLARTMTAKRWFDVVGHYGREDVLRPPTPREDVHLEATDLKDPAELKPELLGDPFDDARHLPVTPAFEVHP